MQWSHLGIRKCGQTEMAGAHPALVSRDIWEAVQRMSDVARETAKRAPRVNPFADPRRLSTPYLLSGMLRCERCDSPMHGDRDGHGWGCYVCAAKKRDARACPSVRVSAERLERAVMQAVLSDLLTPARVVQVVREVNSGLADAQGEAPGRVAEIGRQLAQVNRQISNLLDLVEHFGALSGSERLKELRRTKPGWSAS